MLPVTDILHRGLVLSLAGLSIYGIFLGFAVHRETLQKGRGEQSTSLTTLVQETKNPTLIRGEQVLGVNVILLIGSP